jgi:hypothetical protein
LKQLPEKAFLPQIKADGGEKEMDTDEGLCNYIFGTLIIVRYRKYNLQRSGTAVNLICAVSFYKVEKSSIRLYLF